MNMGRTSNLGGGIGNLTTGTTSMAKGDTRSPPEQMIKNKLKPEFLHSVVDIGSNGIRCSISDLSPPWSHLVPAIYESRIEISLLDVLKPPVMMVNGKFPKDGSTSSTTTKESSPSIPHSVIDEMIKKLKKFKRKVDQFRVPEHQQYVVATEALRSAKNSQDVQDDIQTGTGWKVRLLDAREEGLMGIYGVRSVVGDLTGGLVIDMGGGSVQFSWLGVSASNRDDGKGDGISKEPIDRRIENAPSVSIKRGAAAITNEMLTAVSLDNGDIDGYHCQSVRTAVFNNVSQALAGVVPFDQIVASTNESQPANANDGEEISPNPEMRIYVTGGGLRGWGKVLRHRFERERGYSVRDINGFQVVGNMLVDSRLEAWHGEAQNTFGTPVTKANRNTRAQISEAGVTLESVVVDPHGRDSTIRTSSFASLNNQLNLGGIENTLPSLGSSMDDPETERLLREARAADKGVRKRNRKEAGIGTRREEQLPAVTLVIDSVLATLAHEFLLHALENGASKEDYQQRIPRIVIQFCEGGVRQGVLFRHQAETEIKMNGLQSGEQARGTGLDGSAKCLLDTDGLKVWESERKDKLHTADVRTVIPSFCLEENFSSGEVFVEGENGSVGRHLNAFNAFMAPILPSSSSANDTLVDQDLKLDPPMVVENMSHRQRIILAVMMCERRGGLEGMNQTQKTTIWRILWGSKGRWSSDDNGHNQLMNPLDGMSPENGGVSLGKWLGDDNSEMKNEARENRRWEDGLTGLWPIDLSSLEAAVSFGSWVREAITPAAQQQQ